MNYLALITQFWRLRREMPFSSIEADLYYYLVETSNSLRWKNPFQQSNLLICATLGVTEKTVIGARNRLKTCGLIAFTPGFKRSPSVYTLLLLENAQGKVQGIREESGGESGSVSGGTAPAIIKHKPNQTKGGTRAPAKSEKQFTPPNLAEVLAHAADLELKPGNAGAQNEAPAFFDHFTSNGWLVGGKSLMVDWRASFSSWMRRRSKFQSHTRSSAPVGAGYSLSAKIAENNKPKC